MKLGVSLYSYQAAYASGKMSIEDCFKAIKALPGNVDGVEFLVNRSDEVLQQVSYDGRGLTRIADRDRLKDLIEEYGLTAACYDSIICRENFSFDDGLALQRNVPQQEYERQLAALKNDIDYCASLGFKLMRAPNVYGICAEAIRDSLLYARDKGVKLCAEIHAPLKVSSDTIVSYLEIVDKTCPEAGGLLPDMAIFSRKLPRALIRKSLADGADPELVNLIDNAYEMNEDMAAVSAHVKSATTDPKVLAILDRAKYFVKESPENMKSVAKYIHHVHAKFYEVDENYIEHGIDFVGAIKVLKEIGFDGYLCSEFEGQTMFAPDELDEVEQVRRQTVMVQNIIASL